MRIAHVTATFPPYMAGTGNVCYYNAMELARLGHQVSVFTAAGPSTSSFDPPGVTVHRLPSLLRFGNAPLLPGLMGIRDVDIIHLHYPFIFGAELVTLVARQRRIPIVLTYHNDLIGKGFRRYLFNLYSPLSTGLVLGAARKLAVVSAEHARTCRIATLLKRRWKDVVEIPNGVDTELFHPLPPDSAVRKKFGISPENPMILFVGALDKAHYYSKGVPTLLRAFAKVSGKDVILLIVGEGDWKARYQAQASEMGIGRRTIFAGYVPFTNLPNYYSSADILVLPSESESFGMVLIEAMACKKPVIATDLESVRSVVTDKSEGLLFPAKDAESLADKIQYLLNDSKMRQEMGEKGRAKVEALYAWPKIIPRLLRMYEEVLDGRTDTRTPGED